MNYFGPEKLRKPDEIQIETPIGQPCAWCEEPIQEGDMGTQTGKGPAIHHECSMRGALGSVGHQKKLCSCYGGNQEDPPEMTRREAAIAACIYFELRRPFAGD
ncbi:MAG: hypothetical protein V4621_07755 [Pseudomonadota bacterium]